MRDRGPDLSGRRGFGLVVVLGVATSGATAYLSTRRWAEPRIDGADAAGLSLLRLDDLDGQLPLATALGLVVLAAWGVLLVTRGRVRRAVAGLAVLAAAGTLATVVSGWWALPRDFRERAEESGLDLTVRTDWTAWYPLAVLAAVASLLCAIAALRWCGGWPEMGAKYDAPSARTPAKEPEDEQPEDLWRAMDEGRDPTDRA